MQIATGKSCAQMKESELNRFMNRVAESLAGDQFVRLVLSSPSVATDGPERIMGRRIDLKGAPHLSLTFRYATRDETKNIPVGEASPWLLGQVPSHFRSALLCTTTRDWQLHVPAKGAPRLVEHKPSSSEAPARQHDLARETWMDASATPWLRGLGLVDSSGKVRPAMADKFRQMQRYTEIVFHLAKDCGWIRRAAPNPASRPATHATAADRLVIADMGCGKGYLTFSAWHLLRRRLGLAVKIIGVEKRADLAAKSRELAQQLGAADLEFVSGDINSVNLPRLDALIALHACDTATDAAIRRGIELGAHLIVVAPCCHREVRPQMGHPEPLAPVLRHGLMEERMAEWVTDGLRALFLEWAGYGTKVFEFVASEHTPKNLMIAAVRAGKPFQQVKARQRLEHLKEFFGVKSHALDGWLGADATGTRE